MSITTWLLSPGFRLSLSALSDLVKVIYLYGQAFGLGGRSTHPRFYSKRH